MFRLDNTKAITLQLTNDAFYYLKEDEDPLDEDNLEEALEVLSMFPNGFEIEDNWKPVEDSDLIEATFIPYIEVNEDYDMSCRMAQGYHWQIKFTRENRYVKLWSFKESTNERVYMGEFQLRMSKSAAKDPICFATGDWRSGHGCLSWLKYYEELKPGAIKIPNDLPIGI